MVRNSYNLIPTTLVMLTNEFSQYVGTAIPASTPATHNLTTPIDSPFGLSLAVNGNLVNSDELRTFLDFEARRHVNTDSDSELLYAPSLPPDIARHVC